MFESRIDRMTTHILSLGLFSGIELVGLGDSTMPLEQMLPDGRKIRRFRVYHRLRESGRLGRLADFIIWYIRILSFYVGKGPSCINAHSLSVLPLCWLLAQLTRAKLVYEPHELETETASGSNPMRPLMRAMEGFLARRCDAVVLVADGIAKWYEKKYKLQHLSVVRNLPMTQVGNPLPADYYRKKFGIADSSLVFLYQGLIGGGRGIDLLLECFRHTPPDRHLVLLGYGDLVPMVERAAKEMTNVHFHPAVTSGELLRYSAAADVGIMMIENVSLSYYYCYPNKYCEYLTAGVPVIFSDFLWLRREAEQYNCGWAAPLDAAGLAGIVAGIDRKSVEDKGRGARLWAEENTWSREETKLKDIYRGMFQPRRVEAAA
jgi:glycosyltransferase involved in cell wall biosynthesis